jgi:RNA polymerase sigma-70 factor (ECF subfamily)
VKDKAHFEAIYESTRQSLYAYLYRSLGDSSVAEDLFQETYIRFFRSDTLGRDDSKCRAYLFRIAANLIVDHYRKEKRQKRMVDEMLLEHVEVADDPTDVEGVVSALDRLSVQNRNLLWLAYVEEFDHASIGHILGLRPKSVRVLLHRAKQKLAALLGQPTVKKGVAT